jgi:hypothetical protein
MSATAETATVRTSLAALRAPAAEPQPVANVTMGFASLQSFELMQRAARLLSASTLVPKDYQDNLPNCVIALNMAQRMGADPLMVMQNLYVVHGRPSWSAQFLIGCFNQCGRFSAMRYKWGGTPNKDDWSCQAYAKELSTGEVIYGPEITIALAKREGWDSKNGSKWKTIPQLMLMYRAAAWLVRTHAPEISMGLQSSEEVHDVYDAARGMNGDFEVTTESLRQAQQTAGALPGATDKPAADPAIEAAINSLKGAPNLDDLDEVMDAVRDTFKGRELSAHVDAAYRTRKSELNKDAI